VSAKAAFVPETVVLADLKPHARNYRQHPDDQLEHLMESLREHGWYRNIIVARDGTILAGHGIVAAARKMGYTEGPAIRLPLEPNEPRALKVLAGDNGLGHLAEVDDRALSELLKEVKDFDLEGLLGTGYDEAMLANLVYVTRPASEIKDFDAAAEWAGMPAYDAGGEAPEASKIVVHFRTDQDRAEFARLLGLRITAQSDTTWWPPMERNDLASVRFEVGAE